MSSEQQQHVDGDYLEKQQTASPAEMDHPPIARITTSGENDEFVHIGGSRVYKSELMAAFGGNLNPGGMAYPSRKFGNPGPLGLSAFALTTFCLSLVNVQARGATNASSVIGPAFFYGGMAQFLAGMWELIVENTFGGCALSSYGAFWLSWAYISDPNSGIAASYASADEFNNVIGFFLMGWTLFTFMLVLLTLKSTVMFFSLFFCLDLTFLFLCIGAFTGHVGVTKAGGVFGIITSFIAWYNAYAGIANKENAYIVPRPIYMPGTVLH